MLCFYPDESTSDSFNAIDKIMACRKLKGSSMARKTANDPGAIMRIRKMWLKN
jgi:hypothetical protein